MITVKRKIEFSREAHGRRRVGRVKKKRTAVEAGRIPRISRLMALAIRLDRMLLTGISDGGTFALADSLQGDSPFTAYAVIACALPPGDLQAARGKRIYWVHGALDWMFLLKQAQRDAGTLEQMGAHISLRIVHDLSHTYPRDENGRILTWFDPSMK